MSDPIEFSKLSDDELDKIIANPTLRRQLAYESFLFFFYIYYASGIEYGIADFHKEIFEVCQNLDQPMIAIAGFRGSAKSTIVQNAFTLWSIFGKHQKQFVLNVAHTQKQARLNLENHRSALDEPLLRQDFGPFKFPNEQWDMNSLVMPKYGARITSVSIDERVRGMQHKTHRPDLIIFDDIEDSGSVESQEVRDKVVYRFKTEFLSLGNRGTHYIVLGNVLHRESLMMQLKKEINGKNRDGKYLEFPIVDDAGESMWPAMFPDRESIKALRRRIGDERSWRQYYLLQPTDPTDVPIRSEWIKYGEIPAGLLESGGFQVLLAIDPAISGVGDYTAAVTAYVVGEGENLRIYIQANPLNLRIHYVDAVDRIKNHALALAKTHHVQLIVEANGFQKIIADMFKGGYFPVHEIRSHEPKNVRLTYAAPFVRDGRILFASQGCEMLINQITGFGSEKYDDLADAFSMLIYYIMTDYKPVGTYDPAYRKEMLEKAKRPRPIRYIGGEPFDFKEMHDALNRDWPSPSFTHFY